MTSTGESLNGNDSREWALKFMLIGESWSRQVEEDCFERGRCALLTNVDCSHQADNIWAEVNPATLTC